MPLDGVIMPRGGARNRSGPPPDENSGRSDARGYSLTALPAQGYSGLVPEWPLPKRTIMVWRYEDKARWQEVDNDATARVAERELALWEWAWRTPQACAWSMPSESWRSQTVARWVRQAVKCESDDATAADHGQLHRYADQIGLTTAGLREMGWKVAVDEVAKKAAEAPAEKRVTARDRLKVVSSADGA